MVKKLVRGDPIHMNFVIAARQHLSPDGLIRREIANPPLRQRRLPA
jgi:hypothetical protein